MFVKSAEGQKKPVKIWLNGIEQVGSSCLEKVTNLSNLPFVYKWPALMPNCHEGYGMPIGAVIATENVIIPNAVGEDIGCGMCFVQTDIHANLLKIEIGQTPLIQAIIDCIMRNVPVGLAQHQEKQDCRTLSRVNEYLSTEHRVAELEPELRAGYYQVGTLGDGGHFIEIQEDESGYVGIMLHSGSRNIGPKVCKYFNEIAKTLNTQWYSSIPKEYDLAFLPEKTSAGKSYIHWMNLAVDFAAENRAKIMSRIKEIIFSHVKKYADFIGTEKGKEINCHHNYVALENHYGQDVWVHRRGAIRAREGDAGIVPGSMGSFSYIVEGRGNPDSFNSCSNGAGRNSSRGKSLEHYSAQSVIKDLKQNDVTLGKNKNDDVAEECRWAYNDIDAVIAQELDLVKPVKKLKTIGVIKG